MGVQAKICGISTPEAVTAALDGGAAFLGFMFFEKSPRNIAPDAAWRLAQPARGKAKIVAVLVAPSDAEADRIAQILQPDLYPELYGKIDHVVRINYYKPRGDNKEGWDNIDIFGWLGYPMQIKVNFLCRDSILAAPIVLDLALFMDFAHRAGMSGVQEWLSFYWKSPMTPSEGLYPEHDLFIQSMKLKNTLRYTKGDDLITHLGAEYYD